MGGVATTTTLPLGFKGDYMFEWLTKALTATPKPISKVEIGRSSAAIATTLLYMKDLVIRSDRDRIVKETAKNIINNIDPRNYAAQVSAIVEWVRRNFKYTRDIYGVEELTDPVTILHSMAEGKNNYSSDCDDFATLIAALLRVIGFHTRLEAVGVGSPWYNHARLSVFYGEAWHCIEGTKNTPVGYAQPSVPQIMSVEVV
jgi:transglutaminase-like putative cysteine protease